MKPSSLEIDLDSRHPPNGPGEAALALRDLHKSFGAQHVLNGISLTVTRGETLAVLGEATVVEATVETVSVNVCAANGLTPLVAVIVNG